MKAKLYDYKSVMSRDDARLFEKIARKHYFHHFDLGTKKNEQTHREATMDAMKVTYAKPTSYWIACNEMYKLADKYNIPDKELEFLWFYIGIKFRNTKAQYSKMPKSTHRDNKNATNRGGSSSRGRYSDVRFPSKKRSKACWVRFYKLFPYLKPEDKKKR